MKFRYIIISIFFFFSIHEISAQFEFKEKTTPWEKIFVGGNFSLQFGDQTFIELSPVVGYQIIPRISAGIGFIYQFYSEKYLIFDSTWVTRKFKSNIYGSRVFSQFTLIKNLNDIIPLGLQAGIVGYAEYELLNIEYPEISRQWIENFYIGGGLELPMSEKFTTNVLVLWNLNQSEMLQYQNPSVRIGFIFFPFRKKSYSF